MQSKLTIMTSKHPSSLLAWLFVMLPILAFFSACSNHKAGDEKKAYALFLEAINHNAAGDKKTAITLIDSALQMNAADTTRKKDTVKPSNTPTRLKTRRQPPMTPSKDCLPTPTRVLYSCDRAYTERASISSPLFGAW